MLFKAIVGVTFKVAGAEVSPGQLFISKAIARINDWPDLLAVNVNVATEELLVVLTKPSLLENHL